MSVDAIAKQKEQRPHNNKPQDTDAVKDKERMRHKKWQNTKRKPGVCGDTNEY